MKTKNRSPDMIVRSKSSKGVIRHKNNFWYQRSSSRFVYDKKKDERVFTEKSFSFNILGVIVACLIFICLVRVLADKSPTVTFYGFLNMLANAPVVDLDIIAPWFGDVSFTGIWSIFAPIAEFLQTTLQLVCYFGVSLWNALMYVLYFIRFIFGF